MVQVVKILPCGSWGPVCSKWSMLMFRWCEEPWGCFTTFDLTLLKDDFLLSYQSACCKMASNHKTLLLSENFCWPNKTGESLCWALSAEGHGGFKNVYLLLNLRALKISMLYKNHSFQCMGNIFCEELIPHKISYPYIERCVLYLQVKI